VPVSRESDGKKSDGKETGLVWMVCNGKREKGNLQQCKRQIAMDAGLQLHLDVEVEF
jgi:hypothetical protein